VNVLMLCCLKYNYLCEVMSFIVSIASRGIGQQGPDRNDRTDSGPSPASDITVLALGGKTSFFIIMGQ